MAADLHVHILEGIGEGDLALFFSNALGSRWFNPKPGSQDLTLYEKIDETPNIWIGEVSWLKAALFEGAESFVPSGVAKVQEIIGEDLPTVDDALIEQIREALGGENGTGYSVTKPDPVIDFLLAHRGKRCFTVSW